MNPKIKRLHEIADELRAMFPDYSVTSLTVIGSGAELALHGSNTKPTTYGDGTTALRELGLGERRKLILGSSMTALKGHEDKITVTAYCDGLPPSCRMVKFTERIPKTETADTGEFIEVERERVECGKEAARRKPQPNPIYENQTHRPKSKSVPRD